MSVHAGVKFPCKQCGKNFHHKEKFLNIKGLYMEVSNTLVGNVVNGFLIKEIWLNTKGDYTKESNSLAKYAVYNFHGNHNKVATKEHYMREL